MSSDDVVVKKSKIQGKGVFANRNFKKGETIIKWDTSHELSSAEIKKLSGSDKKYIAFLEGKYIVMQSPAKYVNHSCNANTFAKNFCDIAKRDIEKGEEITGDYSENNIPGEKMKCSCGSKNCKKVIITK